MLKNYILPEKNRLGIQKIWGKPLFGTEEDVIRRYQEIISKKKYKLIITVGDYCSHHLQSDIKVFDKKVQRKDFNQKHGCALTINNPPGTIAKEAWDAIKEAIENKTNLCINGEEDLLVIPAVILAKSKTLIVYGFPNKGICLVEASLKNKTIFSLALKKYFEKQP